MLFKGKLGVLIFIILFLIFGVSYCARKDNSYLGRQLEENRQAREDEKGLSEAYEKEE